MSFYYFSGNTLSDYNKTWNVLSSCSGDVLIQISESQRRLTLELEGLVSDIVTPLKTAFAYKSAVLCLTWCCASLSSAAGSARRFFRRWTITSDWTKTTYRWVSPKSRVTTRSREGPCRMTSCYLVIMFRGGKLITAGHRENSYVVSYLIN